MQKSMEDFQQVCSSFNWLSDFHQQPVKTLLSFIFAVLNAKYQNRVSKYAKKLYLL